MTLSTKVTVNYELSGKSVTYELFSLCKPTQDSCVY